MQTQFKWNSKQRLMVIESIAIGMSNVTNIKHAQILSNDILLFSSETAEFLNTSEYIQSKLKFVFDLAKTMNVTILHDKLVKLEPIEENTEETGFAV